MGSGRRGGRPTTAGSFSFEVNHVLRGARALPGRQKPAGLITWTCAFLDRPQRLAYELERVDERHQAAHCTFAGTDYHSGEELIFRFKATLQGTPAPYGGLRWWFVCPSSRKNVGKLYMPIGGRQFASREAWRLAYPSQGETTAARISRRAIKLRRKLDPDADCALGDIFRKSRNGCGGRLIIG
jgi:hypothetical protein